MLDGRYDVYSSVMLVFLPGSTPAPYESGSVSELVCTANSTADLMLFCFEGHFFLLFEKCFLQVQGVRISTQLSTSCKVIQKSWTDFFMCSLVEKYFLNISTQLASSSLEYTKCISLYCFTFFFSSPQLLYAFPTDKSFKFLFMRMLDICMYVFITPLRVYIFVDIMSHVIMSLDLCLWYHC